MTEPVLTYRSVSTASQGPDQVDVALSTEARTDGLFFDGFLTHPEQAAAALLLVAKVARTRFYEPPGLIAARIAAADPVVTASADRLRFESFSEPPVRCSRSERRAAARPTKSMTTTRPGAA